MTNLGILYIIFYCFCYVTCKGRNKRIAWVKIGRVMKSDILTHLQYPWIGEVTANLWHLNRNQFCAKIISPISIDSQIKWKVFNFFAIITSSEVLKLSEKDHNPFSPPRVLYQNRLIIVVIIASRPLWGCSALCTAAPPHCKTPLHSADRPLCGHEENQRKQRYWDELRKPRQQQSLVHCGVVSCPTRWDLVGGGDPL